MCQEETEEEFYSDDELNQHEAALRRQQTESSSKPAKAVELNKSVIDIERSKSSEKPDTKLETPPVSAKPVEEAPAPPESQTKPSKPAEVAETALEVKPVKEPRSLVSGSCARERWAWAYTKIIQVGEIRDQTGAIMFYVGN